tara:strand:- start:1147 stop:1305 length:159 start_codon:yes stop_codon:yes gene_type:complete
VSPPISVKRHADCEQQKGLVSARSGLVVYAKPSGISALKKTALSFSAVLGYP